MVVFYRLCKRKNPGRNLVGKERAECVAESWWGRVTVCKGKGTVCCRKGKYFIKFSELTLLPL